MKAYGKFITRKIINGDCITIRQGDISVYFSNAPDNNVYVFYAMLINIKSLKSSGLQCNSAAFAFIHLFGLAITCHKTSA